MKLSLKSLCTTDTTSHYGIGVSNTLIDTTSRGTFNFHLENTENEFGWYAKGTNGFSGSTLGVKRLMRCYYSENFSRPQLFIGEGVSREYQLELTHNSAAKPGFSGYWTNTSDERIKRDIELADLNICYTNIKNIPLKRFRFKEGVYTVEQNPDIYGLGFIAQDVQAVFPKAVTTKKMHGLEDCLDLDQGQLINTLYGCVQKLIQKMESLENEINILKNSNL